MSISRKGSLNGRSILQDNLVRVTTQYLASFPRKKGEEKKTLGDLLLEAGYAESVAKRPWSIYRSEPVAEGLGHILDRIENKRDSALGHLTDKKLKESSGRDTAYIFDVLSKNHQLLSGKPTENVQNLYDDEQIRAFTNH